MFNEGDVVELDKDFSKEGFDPQEKYIKTCDLKFNKLYIVHSKFIAGNKIFINTTDIDGENLSGGHFVGRFKLYKEDQKQEIKGNGFVYCNCGGPWVMNVAGGNNFKVCKVCGKEVQQ